jgi:hypothetical protein
MLPDCCCQGFYQGCLLLLLLIRRCEGDCDGAALTPSLLCAQALVARSSRGAASTVANRALRPCRRAPPRGRAARSPRRIQCAVGPARCRGPVCAGGGWRGPRPLWSCSEIASAHSCAVGPARCRGLVCAGGGWRGPRPCCGYQGGDRALAREGRRPVEAFTLGLVAVLGQACPDASLRWPSGSKVAVC